MMRFAKNILDSIADAGEKFLDLKRSGGRTGGLFRLCEDLISHKGVASGMALAREVVHRYRALEHDEKRAFFLELGNNMGPDLSKIQHAAHELLNAPDTETLRALSLAMESKRQELFSRMNLAPNSTPAIVELRQDLIGFVDEHPALQEVDDDLKKLLAAWFNPGFLTLKRIDWDTEASILEKIIRYEVVHSIENWDDLKQRLIADRRCFAYFHPALEDEPLIFVEVALTRGMASSVQEIIGCNEPADGDMNTAVFYSINNCQAGLRGVALGNFLIKRVVAELARELPSIKTYCTLSPVPGFAGWLRGELASNENEMLSQGEKEVLRRTGETAWHQDPEKCNALKKPLLKACANYLVNVKKAGHPINAVANFHFGNGASLERMNWLGDTSEHGLAEYHGIMVNYLYDLRHIESNHEAYVQSGHLDIAKSVRAAL